MLVETLRLVFHAATALADTRTSSWAEHELGTLHGVVDHIDPSRELLNRARWTREANGDERGLAATDHNLRVLFRRPLLPSSAAALAVAVAVAGLILAETVSGGSTHGNVASSTARPAHHTSAAHSTSTPSPSTTSQHQNGQTNSQQQSRPPAAAVDPSAIKFPVTPIDRPEHLEVELTDRGPGPLTMTSAPELAGASQFTIASDTDTCAAGTVKAGASCGLSVVFIPTAPGEVTATLTFTDNAAPATQHVPLSGTGQPASNTTTTVTSAPPASTVTTAPPTSTTPEAPPPTTNQAPIQ